jgi:hypothetical protein
MGLRRPTPTTVTWRRWLLRAAAVLPRIEPHETIAQERERVAREQVLETLERVADDPSVKIADNAALRGEHAHRAV